MKTKPLILGVFSDEDILMSALGHIRKKGLSVADVFSPYPIHGVEKAAGIKKTRMLTGALVFGILGLTLTLAFLYWSAAVSYPLRYGGKPLISTPSWIVIGFVLTINVACFLSVVVFFVRSNLFPGREAVIIDKRVTDDKFIIAIDLEAAEESTDKDGIAKLLIEHGAEEVMKHQ